LGDGARDEQRARDRQRPEQASINHDCPSSL
jgi:hypothetical protein